MDRAGHPDRRALLAGGLGAATVALVGGSSMSAAASATGVAPDARPSTPAAAFARLMAGNERWVSGDLQHPDRDPDRRELVAQIQQKPFGSVLSCIDSRVPPELIFDTGLGALYVMRTGGEAIGPVVTGSVEYGPVTSGTPLIVVLGHQRCGAVEASYKSLRDNQPLPGNLEAIVRALQPAYEVAVREDGRDPVETMARAQVRLTAVDLRSNSDLAPLVQKGTLAVVGAFYSLDTGEVEVLSGAPS